MLLVTSSYDLKQHDLRIKTAVSPNGRPQRKPEDNRFSMKRFKVFINSLVLLISDSHISCNIKMSTPALSVREYVAVPALKP